MTPPLLMLVLLAAHPARPVSAAARLSARSESSSAVDVSAAQRFGWISALRLTAPAAARIDARIAPAQLWLGSTVLSAVRSSDELVLGPVERMHAAATRWFDELPVKIDAQDGGVCFAFRVRPH